MSTPNKRALAILAGGVVLVLIFQWGVNPLWDRWNAAKNQISSKQASLEKIGLREGTDTRAQQKRLAEDIPVFEMPQSEDQQRLLFARKLDQQLQQCGIRLTSQPQYQAQAKLHTGLKQKNMYILRLKCRGKGNFRQVMNLLAKLYENPYLYTVEEFQMAVGEKNRQEIDVTLTVSTLCKKGL